MKNYILLTMLFPAISLMAQNVGIGTSTPNASAKLDIVDANRGVLIPRIALTNTAIAAPVTAPATSLLVYNTATAGNVTPGFYYWDGTQWVRISSGIVNSWLLSGNTGTNPANDFVGTTDNQALVLRTNNIERMRLLTNGNVGIGTATPGYRLDLANGTFAFGNANVRTETRNDAGLQGNAGAQSGFFETVAPVNYPAGATSWWHLIDVRHSNNANNYALQIAGSFFDQELWFRKTNGSALTAWTRLLSATSGWTTLGNAGTNPAINFLGTTDNQSLVIRTNNTERIRVLNTGNVGIGTNAPANTLSVNGTIQAIDVFAAGGQNIIIGDDTYLSDIDVASRVALISTSNPNLAELKLGNTGTNPVLSGNPGYLYLDQELRIQNNSNQFRRAQTPQIFTDAFNGNGVHISNNEVEEGGFWADGNYAMVYSPGDNDLVKFVDEDGWDNAGTAYDGTALRARIDGGGQYFQVSDRNAKENITKLPNGLSSVLQLNGYSYDFKLFPDEIRKGQKTLHAVGVIAQEVQAVFPEAVSETDGNFMVNYDSFVPLFIEAIKEQQKLIEDQRLEIEKMREEIELLKNQK